MNHYLDIHIQPDAEMHENELLNKVYTKLHKALYDLQTNDIGISFPEYHTKLGKILRLHSSQTRLNQLQQHNWLGGLIGYCKLSAIQTIPNHTQHRTVSRIQPTMTTAKLQRLITRGTIPQTAHQHYKTTMQTKSLKYPYLELQSTSNGHKHRHYIQLGSLQPTPTQGHFNHFGLSKTATIPWF